MISEPPKGLIDVHEVLRYLATDRYMSKAEASDYLGISVRTLEARKDLPRYQIERGGKVLFKRSELDQWMARHRICPSEEKNLSHLVDQVLEDVLGPGSRESRAPSQNHRAH